MMDLNNINVNNGNEAKPRTARTLTKEEVARLLEAEKNREVMVHNELMGYRENKEWEKFVNLSLTYAMNRLMLIDIAKKHGLDIEENVKYGGKKHREKLDFIIAKQLDQLAEQGILLQRQEAQISQLTTQIAAKDEQLQQTEEKLDSTAAELKNINLIL